ncbi:ArsR/SmtB family transcription factor [Faecalicoccus pleomorphus]|uniref:ArsR/SmtB family transcription factor n=1 Tax=Faecalicoccus pleomorphus TaxID=1323 RepID=UPI0014310BF1|nr:metalloregulator ArsR/SmtB family transcription factor [Faecalicoccus pleomorphus]MBM6677122.1 helix-turn-helix transcriptional regulator [Faecalicoccus pleomorphus]MBM6764343.1 helix-turn-helix transcriptional regulator [Faecalicoccus pleomorphus]MDB7986738.1 metalloregulator ArsR/SmtB family transcription factor [Faecalicoccus pleomorphus]MDB7990444.1 metalloregulator ArsR/SmtB family transcription factor [Faecalicoccus pleomorphus]MDM8292751.1 metalloregulator ArsR/SmtB family transcript
MEKEYLYQTSDPLRIEEAQKKMPDTSSIEQLADFYKVMGDTTRLKLLMALETGEFCASDLANVSQMTRSAVSHQLKTLKSNKLVKSRKEGKTVYYSLDDEHIHSVLKVALEHILE